MCLLLFLFLPSFSLGPATSVYIHIYTFIYLHTCLYIHVHVCADDSRPLWLNYRAHVCTHMYVYMYIYIYTYIRERAHSRSVTRVFNQVNPTTTATTAVLMFTCICVLTRAGIQCSARRGRERGFRRKWPECRFVREERRESEKEMQAW